MRHNPLMDHPDHQPLNETYAELSELREVTCGALSVVVDFCELLERMGEKEAFVMIARLKDLLS